MSTAVLNNRAIRGPVTAVPVVAGDGVRLVKDTANNRIVAELDETVIFSNSSNVSACTLSEDIQNFNRFRIGVKTNSGEELFEFTTGSNGTSYDIVTGKGNNQGVISLCQFTVSGTAITAVRSEGIVFTWGSNPSYRHNEDMSFIQKVVGIGRKENT